MLTMTVNHLRMNNDDMKDFDHLRDLGMGVKSAKEYMQKSETPWNAALFAPRGGETRVWLWDDDNLVGVGFAHCSPLDSYCKKTGIKVALCNLFAEQPDTLELIADDDSDCAKDIRRRFPDIFGVVNYS